MAKKASGVTARRPHQVEAKDGLTDLRIRIDSQIHQKIKELAEQSGLSINQIVSGVLEGVTGRLHSGYPVLRGSDDFVSVQPRAKCLFVGEPGKSYEHEESMLEVTASEGFVWFVLDYSGRPVRYSVERQ